MINTKFSLKDNFFQMRSDALEMRDHISNLENQNAEIVRSLISSLNQVKALIGLSDLHNKRLLKTEKGLNQLDYNIKVLNGRLDILKDLFYKKHNIKE